jgi:hypothetical protein
MKNTTWQALANRVFVITFATFVPGALLFFGSLHGGGAGLWLAAILVPPLFLDIYGLLKIGSPWQLIIVVFVLQVAFVALVVIIFLWLKELARRLG